LNGINKKVFLFEVKLAFKYLFIVFFVGVSLRLAQTIYYDGWGNISFLNVMFWYLVLGVACLLLSMIIVFFYSEKIRE
jgi:hypothetical protein